MQKLSMMVYFNRKICDDESRISQFASLGTWNLTMLCAKIVLAFITACILYVRSISSVEYRTVHLTHASVSCSAVQTTVTCAGDGSLTPELVRKSGTYKYYEVARIQWGVTKIEQWAFKGCSKLRDITIAESVWYIGSEAFPVIAASSITFPSSLTSLSNMAVNCCGDLTHVNMAFQNGTYRSEDGIIMLTKDGYKGIYIVGAGRCRGTTFQLPSVDKIWTSALRWNGAAIMKVPDSVIEIQGNAFYSCTMHTLELGAGLKVLHSQALNSCAGLESVTISSSNTYFYSKTEAKCAFFGKKQSGSTKPQTINWISITSTAITIPGTVTEIGTSALQLCSNLTSVSVESTSTAFSVMCSGLLVCSKDGSIGKFAAGGAINVVVDAVVTFLNAGCFRDLVHLETVKFHYNFIGCGDNCFRACSRLHTLDFASCTMRSGTGADAAHELKGCTFRHCNSLKTILNWPRNSFSIASEYTFSNCGFEELVIPQQVISIGERAFTSCKSLHTVWIPKTLTSIAAESFSSCTELKNIIFETNSTLECIDSLAFVSCTQLESVTLPDSLTVIHQSCFMGDTMLVNITFEHNNGLYRSYNGAVYTVYNESNVHHTLTICPPGVSSIELHEDTRVIATHAFYSCTLSHVNMNDMLETIESSAFLECTELSFVRLTASIQHIRDRAFDGCVNLRTVLYCNNRHDVNYEGDPFQSNPSVYFFYDFEGSQFCGHLGEAILDRHCNIPTDFFTHCDLAPKKNRIRVGLWVYDVLILFC